MWRNRAAANSISALLSSQGMFVAVCLLLIPRLNLLRADSALKSLSVSDFPM